jgi:inosose dehydratase
MLPHDCTRRRLLQGLSAAGVSMLLAPGASQGQAPAQRKLHVACNQWNWSVFYRREKRDFAQSLEAGLAEVARSGMDGFEPGAGSPDQLEQLGPVLKKHGLEMRSLYCGSTLHDPQQAQKSIETVVAVAQKAKSLGTKIIVTNPSPLRSGGSKDKDDRQLRLQAESLDKLGAQLRAMGLVLAYHNHDVELRNAAREFHHMLLGTDPKNLALCLDCHWVYRGAGNSQVALFDVLRLYGPRVVELHLRQSVGNVWSETFGPGDIDYPAVAKYLAEIGVKPHLVLEQGPEAATPHTMDAIESHRKGRACVEQVFA